MATNNNLVGEILEQSKKASKIIAEDIDIYNDYLRDKEEKTKKEIIEQIETYGCNADEPDEQVIEKIKNNEIRVVTNSFGGNIDLYNDLNAVINFIKRDVTMPLFGTSKEYVIPIFGILSTLASKVPINMFGHNTLLGKYCQTAMTDGMNIYVNDAFWRKIIEKEKIENKDLASANCKTGRVFLLLHELSHIVCNDVERIPNGDKNLKNIAFDIRINSTMERDFENLKIIDYMKQIGVGMSDQIKKEYSDTSPERLYEILKNNQRKNKQFKKEQLKEKLKNQINKAKKELNNQNQSQQGQSQGLSGNQGQNQSQQGQSQGLSGNQGQNQSQQGQSQGLSGNQGQNQSQQGQSQGLSGNQGQNQSQSQQMPKNDKELEELYTDAFNSGLFDGRNDNYNNKNNRSSYNASGLFGETKKLYDNAYNDGYEHGQNNEEMEDLASLTDNHVMKPSEIKEIMKEMGVPDETLDRLGYSNDNIDKEVEKKSNSLLETSIIEYDRKLKEVGLDPDNMKIPGSHIYNAAVDNVKIKRKGKLTWYQKIAEKIYGSGLKTEYTENVLSPLFYVEELTKDLGTEFYSGVSLNIKSNECVLILLDTSGSMGAREELSASLTEVIGMKDVAASSESAKEVVVFFADTVLRGDPLEIKDENIENFIQNGIDVSGRGGTDLIKPINQAFQHKMLKSKKIKSIIYFSDLGCEVPEFEKFDKDVQKKLKNGEIDITYIAVPNYGEYHDFEKFKAGVKDYAETIKLKEGEIVDLRHENKSRYRYKK